MPKSCPPPAHPAARSRSALAPKDPPRREQPPRPHPGHKIPSSFSSNPKSRSLDSFPSKINKYMPLQNPIEMAMQPATCTLLHLASTTPLITNIYQHHPHRPASRQRKLIINNLCPPGHDSRISERSPAPNPSPTCRPWCAPSREACVSGVGISGAGGRGAGDLDPLLKHWNPGEGLGDEHER